MKKLLLFASLIFCCRDTMAQKIIERKNKLVDNVTERYDTYIEGDKQVKQGNYKAFFKRKTVIASGKYDKDKKVGVWRYFDSDGKLMQNYDYDAGKLLYEEPEEASSGFKYAIDDTIKDNDKVTQPVRIGGRYFGYVPYVKLFKLPSDSYQNALTKFQITIELLISPMGRVYDMQVKMYTGYNEANTYNINVDQLSSDDRNFIPATFNGKPIASRLSFTYKMDGYGTVDLY